MANSQQAKHATVDYAKCREATSGRLRVLHFELLGLNTNCKLFPLLFIGLISLRVCILFYTINVKVDYQ